MQRLPSRVRRMCLLRNSLLWVGVATKVILTGTAAFGQPVALRADLCIYEATPGGIAMAVRAARGGLDVVLVNHTSHLGGAPTSGLSVWDTLYEGYRAPIYNEVRQAIFDYYRRTYGDDSQQYRDALPGKSGHTNGKFEAKVFEQVVSDLVAAESRIKVLKGYFPVSADRQGRLIDTVRFRSINGNRQQAVAARIFADGSYEGDLLPVVDVAFRVGRESKEQFGEPHAGRLFMSRRGGAAEADDAPSSRRRLNLRHFGETGLVFQAESTGEGDDNVQAFNYRTVLSDDASNATMPPKPQDYDEEFFNSLEFTSTVNPVPNQKLCWNRPQLVGLQTEYVLGDWRARQEVMDRHWQAMLGLLWHLQNAPSVPDSVRAKWRRFGIAKDEFVDNNNRPYEIYVREGRRLVGRYVITEHDLVSEPGRVRTRIHGDSIAFTDWYMDSHACTTETVSGSMHEGKHTLHSETRPGEIPWRSLIPREIDNLIVPVCLSASHVAWGAVRLEPTWMHVGEVAGFAAAMAIERGVPPSKLDVPSLQAHLAQNRVALSFLNDVDATEGSVRTVAAQFFATQGFFPSWDARLSAPCDETTAAAWLDAVAAIAVNKHDSEALARRMRQIEADMTISRRGILFRSFRDLAETAFAETHALAFRRDVSARALQDASPLTRGEVLGMLYGLVRSTFETVAAPRRPHVLFIAVDDVNDWMSCLTANSQAKTPNFDRLSSQGLLFTRAYCAAPACNPSRVALLTGIRPSSSGMYVNAQKFRKLLPDTVTLPQLFAKHGYEVRGAGKIFHHGDPDPQSWSFKLKHPLDPVDRGPALPGLPGNYLWKPTKIAEAEMGDAYVSRWAEEELSRLPERPTFLAVGFYRPHMPWMVPQTYFDMFPLDGIQIPEVDSRDLEDVPDTGKFFANRRGYHREILELDEWKKAVRGYLASIAFCDAQLGRVLQAYESGPWHDKAIIVLWGDHGMHLGEKEHWTKYALWEDATRTPLMFVVPGVTPPGSRCDVPVSLLDLYPTMCDLCALEPPPALEGTSLLQQLLDPSTSRSEPVVTTFGPNNHAVRTRRWRYIHYADGGEELYDHHHDPHEWKNLAAEPSAAVAKKRLAAHLPVINRPLDQPSEYIPRP